jgi:hypothetical protein
MHLRNGRQQITELRRQERASATKRYISQLRKKYNNSRKQAHRQIFNDPDAPEPLEEVTHPTTNHLVTDPAGIQDAVHTFFSTLLAAPPPADDTPPPWTLPTATDRFEIYTNTCHTQPLDMYSIISDPTIFHTMLTTLSKAKTPGPDKIPNELITLAPDATKDMLHLFMQCMWLSGYTPHCW